METKQAYIPIEEQETVINFSRSNSDMTIYTTDSTMITKLEKLVALGSYEVVEEHKLQNAVIGKTYRASKKLLTFRSVKRVLTEEQKQASKNRMIELRKNGKI